MPLTSSPDYSDDRYGSCDRCGGPGALPDMTHNGDEPGFTLYEQPALCPSCGSWWDDSTREERREIREWLGTEPKEAWS